MGLFDRFKKKEQVADNPESDILENYPEMLSAKLLFFDNPNVDPDKILSELRVFYKNVDNPSKGKSLLYFFSDIKVHLKDASIPAHCTVFIPDDSNERAEIKEEAFQQNWHWPKANETARKCNYEILVSDFMTRTLNYKTRLDLFMNFLVAVVKATSPQVIYLTGSQKLVEPAELIKSWEGQNKELLFGLINVRLFNLSNSDTKEVLMDSIGLNLLGLPDFQIRFANLNETEIAGLLWSYSYYIFERGDIISNGNTLLGLVQDSKWKCERQISLAGPERVVINVQPV